MFLLGDDTKPNPNPNSRSFFNYIAGFGLTMVVFDLATTWLRGYLMRPRYMLPYALREWAADDEFYAEDEHYIKITFNGANLSQHHRVPYSKEFKPNEAPYDPIVGKWGYDRELGR